MTHLRSGLSYRRSPRKPIGRPQWAQAVHRMVSAVPDRCRWPPASGRWPGSAGQPAHVEADPSSGRPRQRLRPEAASQAV